MTDIGIVSSDRGLSLAAARHPGWQTHILEVDQSPDQNISALVVDVAPESRLDTLQRLTRNWQLPILVEAPVSDDLPALRELADATAERIVSANPLRYALHTRRLVEELQASGDPLETFFATLRFRQGQLPAHALPCLLDYLSDICAGEIERVASMTHTEPPIQVVSLRYNSGVLGSLEVGAHLPPQFPGASEIVVECFCRAHVFHCAPENQSVSVYAGDGQHQISWQPRPADAIVKAFAAWLEGGPRPSGDLQRDVKAITLADAIAEAARSDQVLELGRP